MGGMSARLSTNDMRVLTCIGFSSALTTFAAARMDAKEVKSSLTILIVALCDVMPLVAASADACKLGKGVTSGSNYGHA